MQERLQTVVELPMFQRAAARLLTDLERSDLVYYLAQNPQSGDVVRGSGGVRKVRWAREGRGKSGGVRVITFYTGVDLPLFLLNIYGKNTKVDVSQAEVATLRKLTEVLKETYGSRK